MNLEKLIARIKEEEGFSPYAFWDDAKGGGGGQWTFGYGACAPGEGCSITEPQADGALREKVQQHVLDLQEIFSGYYIPSDKEDALLDMLYNLGESRFRKFRKLIAAVKKGDWKEAGKQVRQSIYYKQVTTRAEENAATLGG